MDCKPILPILRLIAPSALSCVLAIAAAAPSTAAAPKKPKKSNGPVVDFLERITTPAAPSRKKQAAKKKAAPRSAAASADAAVSDKPAKSGAANPAAGTAISVIPTPRPAPDELVQPPKPPPAVAAHAPAAQPAKAAANRPVHEPAASTRAKAAPTLAQPHHDPAAVSATAPAPGARPDTARLVAAEPVRVASGAWEPQTRAAMFAVEPTVRREVYPALGTKLTAVAPIELRTTPAPTAPFAAAAPEKTLLTPGEPVPLPRLPPTTDDEVKLANLPAAEPPPPDPACVDLLAAGVESVPAEAIAGAGGCGAPWPVRVAAIRTDQGRVTIEPPAVMRCGVARSLAGWLREKVAPAAKAKFGSELRGINNTTGYDCRPRNHVEGAKLSEHGRANALDIGAFTLANGRRIVVGTDIPEDQAFVGEVRTAACIYMHTVLGPGSDPSHAEHLHLDMAPRGRTGEVRWCK